MLRETILNWLISRVFCSMATLLLSGEFFMISSLLGRPDPSQLLSKGAPVFNPRPWCWSACMVTRPAQGTAVPFPFLGAKCWRGMTGTDSQTRGVVCLERDLWRSPVLTLTQRKAVLKVKARLPRALLIFTTGRHQCGPLGLFQDITCVQKSVLTLCDGRYWLRRWQDRELKSRTISTGEGQHNLDFQLLYCSLVSWLNSYLLLAGPGRFVLSAAEVTPSYHRSPKVAEWGLPISFSSRRSLPAQLCPSAGMNI